MNTLTPLRRQYLEIKKSHSDCLLLFRIGDFYETFDEDAATLARELDIVLTTKAMGRSGRVPLAGVPHHSLERHLATLIARGYRIAICEQLTEPGKGLIERGVTRIVTPGTILEPGLLDGKTNNYLAALYVAKDFAGIAFADVTTGEFAATEVQVAHLVAELSTIAAAEVLMPNGASEFARAHELSNLNLTRTLLDDEDFNEEEATGFLLKHFNARSLAAFGLKDKPLAATCAAALIKYLARTRADATENLTRLNVYDASASMLLDAHTLRSLDVFETSYTEAKGRDAPSLIAALDRTRTAMGGRLLRRLLRRPSLDKAEIIWRQQLVGWYVRDSVARRDVESLLAEVHDLERLSSRVRSNLATAHELWTLGHSLKAIPALRLSLQRDVKTFGRLLTQLPDCAETEDLIRRGLNDDLSKLNGQGVMRDGFSLELDALRAVLRDGKKTLAEMETRERARTGIRSLRVGFNKVFGYYIEITKPNLHLAPNDYTRKQTLVNAERFVTLELKEYETLVTNARERIEELEASLFRHLCAQVGARRTEIAGAAATIAFLDCMISFAEVASEWNYTCPNITNDEQLELENARHPILEQRMKPDEFIGNDARLGREREARIMLLTGPNMSGKSTFMRSVALIVLMAHAGSFVPAANAVIGLCDRIWTRTGLYDRIGAGESTFMIEMIETAEILHGATSRSLVLLDELGRGTSTLDGLAVARAVVEYIHNHPRLNMKTIFATHYHELTALEEVLPRVINFHVETQERDDEIEFLYKVKRGSAEKSYGIHAAQLAGLPRPVVRRAHELLEELEARGKQQQLKTVSLADHARTKNAPEATYIKDALLAINLDELSPVEAMTKLYDLQRSLRAEQQSEKKRA